MDENKLRRLEKHYKLRVKTGCETCRIRKVKCDETKPYCLRCRKTGRACDGYAHINKAKNDTHAASYRNSAFLALPKKPMQSASSIVRSPLQSLSPDPMQNRSFEYFQRRTLPMWTEFFDSDLWSRTVLQLSFNEPAIKHGVLALSTMHERYESIAPMFTANNDDFAFVQYVQAVKFSNQLLTAHQQGKVSLEVVLVACIIFICYENLAGNYKTAAMHLRNGMRILDQYKDTNTQMNTFRRTVANVIYRFDLQAMTFSDEASQYEYKLEKPPTYPQVQKMYTSNDAARDDLVGITRCVMWLSSIADKFPRAPERPEWLETHRQTLSDFSLWQKAFAKYQKNLPAHEQGDPKIYAGSTLLKMCATALHIIMGSGAGHKSEMAYDAFTESFKTIVDLAETIPMLGSQSTQTPSSTPSNSRPSKPHPIAPNPSTKSTPHPQAQTFTFSQFPNPQLPHPPSPSPSYFTPSFELSPIVPLFIVGSRCRDPLTRRRAIALLLRYRRREGMWDSLGAGMVALQCLCKEEGLELAEGMVRFKEGIGCAGDVKEGMRVKDVFVEVRTLEGRVVVVYEMTTGERERVVQGLWEGMGMEGRGERTVPVMEQRLDLGEVGGL